MNCNCRVRNGKGECRRARRGQRWRRQLQLLMRFQPVKSQKIVFWRKCFQSPASPALDMRATAMQVLPRRSGCCCRSRCNCGLRRRRVPRWRRGRRGGGEGGGECACDHHGPPAWPVPCLELKRGCVWLFCLLAVWSCGWWHIINNGQHGKAACGLDVVTRLVF